MSRTVLAILVCVILLGGSSQLPLLIPASLSGRADAQVYFPIIGHREPIKVFVTVWNDDPYGYSYYTLGFLENGEEVAYEAVLEADVMVYPYSIDTPEPPFMKTVQFEPALDVTLPGQRNPFRLYAWCYKSCEVVTAVRVAQAFPWRGDGGGYQPLTIDHWSLQDRVLSGVARNDSSQALDQARVVVTALDRCEWREAVLGTVSLQPGQETTFTIDPYSAYCTSGEMLIVGQGRAP